MRFSSGCSILLALGLLFSSLEDVRAHVFHLTMDDLPNQPVHGLAHESGVEFAFTIDGQPSNDAEYAAGGPQTTTFIEDPSIEGNSAGILFVGFSEPVPFVQFGVARSVNTRSTHAVIELFDADNVSTGVTNLNLIPMPMFAEGRFTYNGPPISRFTLGFSPQPGVVRFAFDNLRFGVIPEPSTVVLAVVMVGMLGCGRRWRGDHRR
jgi:hypothetical protein